jgi:spore coat polysaccharide biosynthesis protein SpsF
MATWIGIQCRSDSERLPNKFKMKLGARTMLEWTISQAQFITKDHVCVLCPEGDTAVIEECNRLKVPYFEGSKTDLIRRYKNFCEVYKADHVIRLTADCPFVDRAELFLIWTVAHQHGLDLATNADPHTPRVIDGFDVEWFSYKTLCWLDQHATKDEDREHVGKYLYEHRTDYMEDEEYRFKLDIGGNLQLGLSFTWKDIPWGLYPELKYSVDTKEDFDKLNRLATGKRGTC